VIVWSGTQSAKDLDVLVASKSTVCMPASRAPVDVAVDVVADVEDVLGADAEPVAAPAGTAAGRACGTRRSPKTTIGSK